MVEKQLAADKRIFSVLQNCGTELPDSTKPFAKIFIEDIYGHDESAHSAGYLFLPLNDAEAKALMGIFASSEGGGQEQDAANRRKRKRWARALLFLRDLPRMRLYIACFPNTPHRNETTTAGFSKI